MKRDTVNYLMVGVFVIVMAIAFVVFLFAVTGRSGPTDAYYVNYDNVTGLKFGTGVFYEGYRVGQIETIEPRAGDTGMSYHIELSVASGWRIPADSVARVQSSGLISAISIEIVEGQSSEFLKPGDTIAGQGKTDLFSVLNQAAGDFRSLSQDGIMPVLKNVNERVNLLSDELIRFRRDELSPFVRMLHERVDEDLIGETVELIGHLDETALRMRELLGEGNQQRVESFLTHVDDVAVNLNELVGRIESTRLQMNGLLGSLGELVTENRNELRGAVGSAETSMEELELALRTVNEHLGTILYNLEGGSRHMSEFARAIRENPARLIRRSPGAEPGAE